MATRSRSGRTTSPRRTCRRRPPTGSTTWARTPYGCRSGLTPTPLTSPSRYCAAGGKARAGPATRTPKRLLITAGAGGSNDYRVRLWETGLAAFAPEADLAVTVLHFPPGTSKWNKIEHRLFTQISSNWRGKSLTSHEAVVSLIGATRARTELTVTAEFAPSPCPTEKRVPAAEVERLPITGHDRHPE